MDLARFDKEGISYKLIIPAVNKVFPDGSFHTRALDRGSNADGHYRRSDVRELHRTTLITPEIDYEMFVKTNNPDECDFLTVDYYAGLSTYDVVKRTGEKTFIVTEKLQIESKSEELDDRGFKKTLPYYHNTILEYKAFKHHPKKKGDVRYEGDCNTEIELTDDCKFTMYKFIGIQKIS